MRKRKLILGYTSKQVCGVFVLRNSKVDFLSLLPCSTERMLLFFDVTNSFGGEFAQCLLLMLNPCGI